MKWIVGLLVLSLTVTGAMAVNFGGGGQGFSKMGAGINSSTGGGGGGCTMNGIYDLTNTCNDIYLIGRRI